MNDAAWAEGLEQAAPDSPLWAELAELPPERRGSILEGLRERAMTAARTSPPRALDASEALLRAAQGTPEFEPLALRTRGVALHVNGRSAEAVEPFERALALYLERGEELEAARVRRSLVDVLQMAGESERALAEGERARVALEELDQPALLAQLECNVGNVYFRLDRYSDARAAYESAARRFEALEEPFGLAHALYNLGNIETNAHRFDQALRCFADAKPAFEEAGHQVLAADCDYGIGYLDLRRGRLSEAHRALTRAREGYQHGGKPSGAPLCDLDLCELSLRVDAYRDARRYGERALAGLEGLDLDYERAKARHFLGIALGHLGDEEDAARELRAARDAARGLGNKTLAALATLHSAQLAGGAEHAELLAATRDLDASGDAFLAELARLARAAQHLRAGERELGLEELEALATGASPTDAAQPGLTDARVEGLRRLAALALEGGDAGRAEELLREAVGLVDAALSQLESADARIAFFSSRHGLFAALASVLLARGLDSATFEALELIERSRARALAERAETEVDAETRALRERLDVLMREDLEASLGGAEVTGHRRSASVRHEALDRVREALMERRRALRGGSTSGASVASRPAREALARLGPRERVLYYVAAGEGLRAVLLGPGEGPGQAPRVLRSLELDTRALAGGVREPLARLRFQIFKFRLGRAYAERHALRTRRALERELRRLGEALVGPLFEPGAGGLCEGDALLVIPHGALHDVPFAGLHLGDTALIERVELSVARSLRPLEAADGPLPNRRALSCLETARDLPEVERERASFEAWGEGGLDALEVEDFLSELEGGASAASIHIAAHGNFEPGHPLFSGVRLGERHLAAYDLARLDLRGRLVFLSGCETGRLASARGEEHFGPEQALFSAGARGVVSSLWPVEDGASATWISAVVRELGAGADARRAASLATREVIASGAAPGDWAGFVYSGDPGLCLPEG